MDHFEKINGHDTLVLSRISEVDQNALKLIIVEGRPSGPIHDLKVGDGIIKDVQKVSAKADCAVYEINFDHYVGYSVLNESYAEPDNSNELYEGRLFRVYTKSRFLDYIGNVSWASEDHPGPFTHYCLVCAHHVIDIASVTECRIRHLKRHRNWFWRLSTSFGSGRIYNHR